jgi:hypothetical protein
LAIVAGLVVVIRSSSLAKIRTLRFTGPTSSGAAAAADVSRADRVKSMKIEQTQPEAFAKLAGTGGNVQSAFSIRCAALLA